MKTPQIVQHTQMPYRHLPPIAPQVSHELVLAPHIRASGAHLRLLSCPPRAQWPDLTNSGHPAYFPVQLRQDHVAPRPQNVPILFAKYRPDAGQSPLVPSDANEIASNATAQSLAAFVDPLSPKETPHAQGALQAF